MVTQIQTQDIADLSVTAGKMANGAVAGADGILKSRRSNIVYDHRRQIGIASQGYPDRISSIILSHAPHDTANMEFDGQNIWVLSKTVKNITKVPLATLVPVDIAISGLAGNPASMYYDGSLYIWIVDGSQYLYRFNTLTNALTTYDTGNALYHLSSVVAAGDYIWAAGWVHNNSGGGMDFPETFVYRVSTASWSVAGYGSRDGSAYMSLFDGTYVYFVYYYYHGGSGGQGSIAVKPDGTGAITIHSQTGSTPDNFGAILFDGTHVIFDVYTAGASHTRFMLAQDLTTYTDTPTYLDTSYGIAFDGTYYWFANATNYVRVDPISLAVVSTSSKNYTKPLFTGGDMWFLNDRVAPTGIVRVPAR